MPLANYYYYYYLITTTVPLLLLNNYYGTTLDEGVPQLRELGFLSGNGG